MKRRFLCVLLMVLALSLAGCSEQFDAESAEDYPSKPVTLIVPFGSGGGGDLQVRTLEKYLAENLGQPVMVVNKPGGGGLIGCNEVVTASEDGYTLGFVDMGNLLQSLYGRTDYHYLSALDPLAQFSESSSILAVSQDAPWQNLPQLIAYAKAHPGKLKFGHSGIGSTAHLIGASVAAKAGIDWRYVPFNSGGESTAALLGGHVQIVSANPAVFKDLIKNGRVRPLAVSGEARIKEAFFADIPTLQEQGIDVSFTIWRNIVAPKILPRKIKAKLENALEKTINDPEFVGRMQELGLEVRYLNSEESQTRWIKEGNKLTKFLKESGVLEELKK